MRCMVAQPPWTTPATELHGHGQLVVKGIASVSEDPKMEDSLLSTDHLDPPSDKPAIIFQKISGTLSQIWLCSKWYEFLQTNDFNVSINLVGPLPTKWPKLFGKNTFFWRVKHQQNDKTNWLQASLATSSHCFKCKEPDTKDAHKSFETCPEFVRAQPFLHSSCTIFGEEATNQRKIVKPDREKHFLSRGSYHDLSDK